jgi:hypothetical protein
MIGTIKVSTIAQVPQSDNLIINGAMQVAQRGTASTGITSTGYRTADRWRFGVVSQGTWTNTIENDAPSGSGFGKSLKVLCTTADASPASTDSLRFDYRIEGQNLQAVRKGTSEARELTLSFWVKSNVANTYIAELRDIDNTRSVSASYSITSSGVWEKKTIVFPADATGELDNDNNNSLELRLYLGAGSNITSGTLATSWGTEVAANRAVGQVNLAAAIDNYWQITGVQLEVGPVANPFNFKDFGTELAACQRYYQKVEELSTVLGSGFYNTTTQFIASYPFPVIMRTAPTFTSTNNGAVFVPGTVIGASAVAASFIRNNSLRLDVTTSARTAGEAGLIRLGSVGTSSIELSAEL